MCGIAGFLNLRSAPVDRSILRGMVTTLAHRGPDDHGAWADDESGIALGHRRLSVVDLTVDGHQPMRSACGRYWIVFNGEIYNFVALRDRLQKLGHVFGSRSDTEVLLTAFTQWGVEGALPELNGMFAFAAWDREERALYLARDRLGEKPFYYGHLRDAFVFGSELKAIRAHPSFEPHIDASALSLYVRYAYVPGPYSIFEGIHKLPPGTVLCVSRESTSALRPRAYWKALDAVRRGLASPFRGSFLDAERELDERLRIAVQSRMLADVKIGAFLSGGIDSSMIVAIMQRLSARPVQTFTVGFEEREHDEARWAKRIAEHIGTDHTEVRVTSEEVRDIIPRLPDIYDEPFADESELPTCVLSAITRRAVTVALSGDGGDELFAGYKRYLWSSSQLRFLDPVPWIARDVAASAAGFLYDTWSNGTERGTTPAWPRVRARTRRMAELLRKSSEILRQRGAHRVYRRTLSSWHDPGALLMQAAPVEDPIARAMNELEASPIERMMYTDLVTYLPDDILVKVDRASMHVALEVRVPFLDPMLVEFAACLPLAFKLRRTDTKYLLRRLLARYVPQRLFERPKQGFGAPVSEWLRGPLRSWAQDLLAPARLREQGIFRVDTIATALRDHLTARRDRGSELWVVLMFQAWHASVFANSCPIAG